MLQAPDNSQRKYDHYLSSQITAHRSQVFVTSLCIMYLFFVSLHRSILRGSKNDNFNKLTS